MPTVIDSHAHLDGKEFDQDREEVIERAQAAGVSCIVNIGATDGFEGAERTLALAERYPGFLYAAVGVHPHDGGTELDRSRLLELSHHDQVVAIGETGLDFYRDWAPVDGQRQWFEAQVEIALERDLPLIIHSRDAGEECLEVLTKLGAEKVGGVFHCYAEDGAFAEKLREINFLVSFPGIITFPKAANIQQAAVEIPLEQIMVETDAPYLAPVPYRGKRCESAYVVETTKHLAKLKEITFEEAADATSQTAREFFGI